MNTMQFLLYNQQKKSTGLAYLLGFFLFTFGGHYLYLGDWTNAFLRFAVSIMTIAFPPFGIVYLIVFVFDGFATKGAVDAYNNDLLTKITSLNVSS